MLKYNFSPAKVVLINTSFLYIKMIITTLLSLYTTRLILKILGVDDFGLYNLLAGVITLLSFLNAALMQASQRFLSVYIGRNNTEDVKEVFNASFFLHVLFALIIFFLLEIAELFLFDGLLNIPIKKMYIAKYVYQLMVATMVVTVITTPFNAIINAKEDLWFFAVVEVLIAILKLLAVFFLCSILAITLIGLLLKLLWSYKLYPESHLNIVKHYKPAILKEIVTFSGWNTLGALAQVGRTQGTAVVLNTYGGVILNAAYGISNQVNSLLVYCSQMMTTSIAPQIMKAKGEGNIAKMVYLSVLSSKLSFYLSSLFAIPIIIELPFILNVWLGDIPDYVIPFCYYTMIIFMILQLYPGLVRLLQADGHIKYWQICNTFFLLMPIPVGGFLLNRGYLVYSLFYVMIIAQCLTFLSTLLYCKIYVKLKIVVYLVNVVFKPIIILFFSYFVCSALKTIEYEYIRCLLIFILNAIIISLYFYYVILNKEERGRLRIIWRR